MIFHIIPNVGAGQIRFGMVQSEVRKVVGKQPTPFKKAADSAHITDAFRGEGLHVFYKESGGCEAVEFASPAAPLLDGQELIGLPYRQAERLLRRLDALATEDENGLSSRLLGVALYAPSHGKDVNAEVEGVFVFEPGYYELNP